MDATEILTVREVAEYLKISKAKIYYPVFRKQYPHLKIGRNLQIHQSDLKLLDEVEELQF